MSVYIGSYINFGNGDCSTQNYLSVSTFSTLISSIALELFVIKELSFRK